VANFLSVALSLLSAFFLSDASFVALDVSSSVLSLSALLSLCHASAASLLLPPSAGFVVGATTGVGALPSDLLYLTVDTSASLSTFSELSAVVSSLESDSTSASLSVSTLEAFPSPESFESSDALLSSTSESVLPESESLLSSEAPPEPA